MAKKTFAELTAGKTWSQFTPEDIAAFEAEFRAEIGLSSQYADDTPADLPDIVPLPAAPDQTVATFLKKKA